MLILDHSIGVYGQGEKRFLISPQNSYVCTMFMSYMLVMSLNQVVDACDKNTSSRGNISITEHCIHSASNASSTETVEMEEQGNYTKFMNWGSSDIDYSLYHSAIVQLSQETELNIGLIVDTSCTKDNIIKLTKMLIMARKTSFCYQMDVEDYKSNGIIQFLLASKVSLAVLFQPWYISADLLEKIHGLSNIAFITIKLSASHLQHLQIEDSFLKVFNLQSKNPNNIYGKEISHSSSCLSSKQNLPKVQDPIITAYEYPVNVIRVVTKLDMFVKSFPLHVIKDGECEIGIPCRVPTRPGYGNKTLWRWQCCSGAFIDALDKVIRKMKVSLDLYIVEDGTYNGLIHDVNTGKADIALNLTPSKKRAQLVTFTPAVITVPEYITIAIRKDNLINGLNWSSLQHITLRSRIGIAVATLVILLVLFVLENIGHVRGFNQRYPFLDSFSYVNGLLFQRDLGGTLPRRWPGQIVSILFAFGTTVIVSAVAAQLTATNIVEEEHDFKGLNDKRFQDSTYKFGMPGGSYMDQWVDRANLKAKIFKISNPTQAFDRLINKSIDAYCYYSIPLQHEMSKSTIYKNKLSLHNEDDSKHELVFAYSKKLKIGTKLSNIILQMRESGELQYIYKVWGVARATDIVAPMLYSESDERIHHYARYSVEYGLPLALILGGTSVLCAFLLLVENCFYHLRDKRNKYTVNGKERGEIET